MVTLISAVRCTLHLVWSLRPIYTKHQQQLWDDTTDTVLIEYNGVTRKWVAIPIWSNSIVFNENSIASIIAALSLTLGVDGPYVGEFATSRCAEMGVTNVARVVQIQTKSCCYNYKQGTV